VIPQLRYSEFLQVWLVATDPIARSGKVLPVENDNASAAKCPDRRNIIPVSWQIIARFSATHAEIAAAKPGKINKTATNPTSRR
jgi:hypothetical protein